MENAIIYPSKISGSASVPPSKSFAHRLIICASLADGKSRIENIQYSKDIIATINALEQIGAKFELFDNYLEVNGTGGKVNIPTENVDCNESGSTLRFLIPLFSLCGDKVIFTGANRLFERPLTAYEEIFNMQNNKFAINNNYLLINGKINSGSYKIKGNISSQFISGLMMSLPLLEKESRIEVLPPFESKSYVEMTMKTMENLGINWHFEQDNILVCSGNGKFKAGDYTVEGDWSQGAALAVLGAVCGELEIKGLEKNSIQGDKIILNILEKCGVNTNWKENILYINSFKNKLISPGDIDISNCPDIGPVLCALLSFCKGESRIINAGRLRIKESDRIACVEEELVKLGCKIYSGEDYIVINGQEQLNNEVETSSHNDHRLVMALSIMALGGAVKIIIKNSGAISKSWPSFFSDIINLGAKIEII